jgi:hypothetical protein
VSVQEVATLLVVAAALVYLGLRWWRHRSAATCCGERECPAARRTLEKLR